MSNVPRLSRLQKVFYALGTASGQLFNTTVVTWAMYYYVPPAGQGRQPLVSIGLFTAAMTFGRIIDAIIDPGIGWISDRTRSRLGRRIPYILAFGLPTAVTFFFLWSPPNAGPTVLNAVYFAIMINLYFITASLLYIPQGALLPEIAVTSEERVSLATHNALFTMLAAAVVAVAPGLIIQRLGFRGLGLVMGAIGLVLAYLPTLVIRERSKWREQMGQGGGGAPAGSSSPGAPARGGIAHGAAAQEAAALETATAVQAAVAPPLRLVEAVRHTLRNSSFMAFAGSMFCFYLGFNSLMAGIPYIVTVIIGGKEGDVPLYLGTHVLAAIAFFPVVGWLARRIGKRRLYTGAYLALAVLLPLLFFLGKLPFGTASSQALVWLVAGGAVLSVHYVLPGAVTAECVDYDETVTGQRREAMYFGVQSIIQTLAVALSTTFVGALFRAFGFSADRPLGIALLGPMAGFFLFGGFLSFRRYRLG